LAWLDGLASIYGLDSSGSHLASADASFRRYLRLASRSHGSLVVMDAPPEHEDCRPFLAVAQHMHKAGLHVPLVLNANLTDGFLLLTDLGTQTVLQHLPPEGHPEREDQAQAFMKRAIAPLLQWQQASAPDVLPPYDEAVLRRELALFPDWYLAQAKGVALNASQQRVLQQGFDAIVAANLAVPKVFVHRDFMLRNLMVPPHDDGHQPLGVLDFQDALYGPITYDIASLTRDAFASWDEELVMDIVARYWQAARRVGLLGARSPSGWGDDFGEFYRAVEWMGLQRHLKVAGIFARLTLRDGKPRYLADAPRFIGYILHTCRRYRELALLGRLIEQIEGLAQPQGFAYGRM
jgi:N-acetylmuramate 1-kinase